MPIMPPKKAMQTPATTRLALFFFASLGVRSVISASRRPASEDAARLHQGGHVEDDDERCQRQAERDRTVATCLLLLLGQGHQFKLLFAHDHAPPTLS